MPMQVEVLLARRRPSAGARSPCARSRAGRGRVPRARTRAASAASRIRCFEPLDDRVVLAVEEVEQLLHELVVLLVVDVADARRRALLDVRVEARPAEPVVAVELRRSCTCGSGTCAAAGRASRGSRTRARTDRSSARPCASVPRSTIARGHSSSSVTARYGYDLSSFSRMLKRGLCRLMRLNSRKNASTSFLATIHSTRLGRLHHLAGALGQQCPAATK